MKNKICLIILLLISTCSEMHLFAQEKEGVLEIFFPKTINGSVAIHEWVQLPNEDKARIITVDSSRIINGKYVYKYPARKVNEVYLDVFSKDSMKVIKIAVKSPYCGIYSGNTVLDNSHAVITIDSLSKGGLNFKGTISGSPETDMLFKLTCDEYGEPKHRFTDPLMFHVVNFNFIKENPYSQLLLMKIYDDRNIYRSADSLKIALSLFDKSIQNTDLGKKLADFIQKQKSFFHKGITDSFVFYDIMDKKFTFKGYIDGKQLGLIIFWASWCGPCVREMPELQQLHEQFKNRVSFVSLSIDNNKEAWVKAVKKHSVDWLNLAGFPESNSKVADMFGLNVVPSFLIVDSTGNVLLKSLGGYGYVDGESKPINAGDLKYYLNKFCCKYPL